MISKTFIYFYKNKNSEVFYFGGIMFNKKKEEILNELQTNETQGLTSVEAE